MVTEYLEGEIPMAPYIDDIPRRVIDPRPQDCRFRLQDENKPYPRGGCSACSWRAMTHGKRGCPTMEVQEQAVAASVEERREELGQADWLEPRNTANAMLLAGVITGSLKLDAGDLFEAEQVLNEDDACEMIVRSHKGNRFAIKIQQISGEE